MEKETPLKSGYSMPAEWELHDATWLAWPANELSFPKSILSNVEDTYCRIISALSPGEKVNVLVNDADAKENALRFLSKYDFKDKNVIFYEMKSADVWIRDYGPTFLLNRKTGKKAAVKWRYNAYGGKYDDLLYDDITGENVLKASGVKAFRPGIVLEGGSIEVDRAGTLLTTEQCLLNRNRNPNLTRAQIEEYLHEYTGASRTIWLKSGIEGDDTDGHVDDFARFAAKGKVLCAHSDRSGKDGAVLRENLGILENSSDAQGNGFEVLKLPMPKPIVDAGENRQLPASYANFYIANKAVLLPVFGDPNDAMAAEILESVFPGRQIVSISSRELVFGYGGIHCATQQEPAEKR
ncbi:Agmatine deiminase [uncultured archaeon]|nr:Agmatine deiminase [uncultured archaeon]